MEKGAIDTFKVLFKKAPAAVSYRLTIIKTLASPNNNGV